MTWYWEPAHYRPKLGDEVLKAILDKPSSINTADWPIRLQQHTIERAIELSIDGLAQPEIR